MLSSTERVRRKRARARGQGLCITCCIEVPLPDRKVCEACKNASNHSRKRRFAQIARTKEIAQVITSYETAGDRALERHLYADAALWFHRAIDLDGIPFDARLTITEKLKRAYFLGENPSAATPLADWLAKSYSDFAEQSEKVVRSLIDVAAQLHIDSKTEQTLTTLEQATRIAQAAGLANLQTVVDLQRVEYLHTLDRDEEAGAILASSTEPSRGTDRGLQIAYYREKGHAAAITGDQRSAQRHFKRALAAANRGSDAYAVSQVWGTYAFAMWRLGDVEVAKSCLESAILVARENQILWRVSRLYAYYAAFLATMGRATSAREYLLAALAYRANAPLLEMLFAGVGIPLAMKLADDDLLAKCSVTSALERVFQDGNPTYVGWVSAAFAQLYASRNERRRAQALLHRAMPYICTVAWNWDFFLTVARHGSRRDMLQARAILEKAGNASKNPAAAACLVFFHALSSLRDGDRKESRAAALDAASRFEDLNWHGYAQEARSLVGNDKKIGVSTNSGTQPLSALRPALTRREEQVVELVLRGLTNRAIAEELAISENTVEKHVSAIIGRLGVRSRHQFIDALGIVETKTH